ncbi:MAG: hypothetical protein C0507_03230 [Cyanobacteria bacterium PR.3.49]|nr:hypothetical protein [Cyanobacteria bacterium PR.3.49]
MRTGERSTRLKYGCAVTFAAFAACSTLAHVYAAPAYAASTKEWQFEQKHHHSGYHKFYIAPKAVKIVNTNLGYQLVSKAPDWNVSIFRNDDKVICTLTRNQYYKQQAVHPDNLRINKFPVVGKEELLGTKTTVYRGPHHDDWVATFKDVPVEVYDLITAYYKTPPVDGVVLKSYKPPVKGPKKTKLASMWLDEHESGTRLTASKLKELPYNAADFAIPKDFRKVMDVKAVTTSIEGRREAESIIEQMGVGEALGNSRGKK